METLSRLLLTFLLNSLWQVPLITATAWLVSKLLHQGPASHRHAVWMVALTASLVVPLGSVRMSEAHPAYGVVYDYPDAGQAKTIGASAITAASQRSGASPVSAQLHVSFAGATARILLTAYLLFLLFRLTMLSVAFARTVRIRRASVAPQPSALLQTVWEHTAGSLGIAPPERCVSQHVAGPVMIGAWKRTIILPDSLLRETSEEVLTTAIGHEMAHIARDDYALNILTELLCLPILFQPATLLMRRAITCSRELACDELVTRRLMDPAAYARSILTLAHDMVGLPRPAGYSLGVFDGNILEERVKRILNRPFANLKRARLLLAIGLSALAICVVVASGLAISARAQSAALPEMKLAEAAFNSGNFRGMWITSKAPSASIRIM
jgi:beta-lactamase regulating signal transducer with metallopeptidase domain